MTTYNTKDPLGSASVKNLYDNSENLDKATNDRESETWTDRLGKERISWHGMEMQNARLIEQLNTKMDAAITAAGYLPVGNFQLGAEILQINQVVQWSLPDGDGEYYRWEGALKKNIPANSTPQTTGGIEKGAWVLVGIKNWEGVFDADLNAIARLHNVDVSKVSMLTLSTVDNVSFFFNSVSKVCYYALSPVTGQITHISSANGYATLTVSGKTIFIYQSGINAGNVAFRTPKSYGNTHGLFKTVEPNTGTRIHFEPNGYVGSGTVVKVDYMFDDYDTDTMNYRISAILNYVGDPNKTGEGAVTVLNSKSTGHGWGNWPSFHFGFQDDKYCPMKVMLYDSAANQIFAPMMGMWHESKPITLDDYVTANNKIYRAKNTGVTGSAPPSHASGIASDGNIDWEFIRAPRGVDISATVLIGNINSTPLPNLVGHAMQVQEPIAVGRNGRFDFVDEEGKLVGRIISSLGGNGERLLDIISNDGGSRLRLNSTNKTLQLVNLASTSTAKTQNATTQPNISATGIVRVGNVNPYTINKFLGGTAGQEFILESTTANLTTLKHNSAIRLAGETDLVLKDKQALKFLVAADGETVIQI